MKESITCIKSDLFRYTGEISVKAFIKSFLLIEGFRYTFFLRCRAFFKRGNPLYWVSFFFLRHYSYKYGFQIFTNNIGKGFYIGHFGTIIINGGAKIGENVNISPGVIIGQISRGRLKGVPKIEDNVWIGSNAVVVGKITIGAESLIAPGAYVNFDVPPKSLVRGNPGIIFKGKGIEGYIINKWVGQKVF